MNTPAKSFETCQVCLAVRTPGYGQLVAALEIGHDNIAHRIYARFLRENITTAEHAAAVRDGAVLEMRGLGWYSLARLRTRFPRPPGDPGLRARTGPAENFATCPICRDSPAPGYERLVCELEIGHDDVAHLIYNRLANEGHHSTAKLALLTDEQITDIPHIGPVRLARIRTTLPAPSIETMLDAAQDPMLLQLAARKLIENPPPGLEPGLITALARVLAEAAEDYACCARVNARRGPAALPELPNPVSEAVLAAARAWLHPDPAPPAPAATPAPEPVAVARPGKHRGAAREGTENAGRSPALAMIGAAL